MNNVGQNVAAQKAKFRKKFGVSVQFLSPDGTPAGNVRWMRTRSLEMSEREYLPDGISNAADADLRVFEASPVDFPSCQWPAVGSLWRWHGASYTLIAVHPGDDEIGGVAVTLLLFMYRAQLGETLPAEAAELAAQDSLWDDRGPTSPITNSTSP